LRHSDSLKANFGDNAAVNPLGIRAASSPARSRNGQEQGFLASGSLGRKRRADSRAEKASFFSFLDPILENMSIADDPASGDLTLLLNRMQHGDKVAGDRAVALVYDELHRIASRQMRGEHGDRQLQTTALIHEAYLRLVGAHEIEIQNRGHFFAIASKQMRRILVDAARSEHAQKRGGPAAKVSLEEMKIPAGAKGAELLALDDVLSELELFDPRASKVVELRYFGGYTDKEVAEALGVALSTVRRDWEFARSWLFDRMNSGRATEK
jgi:RNA polymerase sigma-70 factor, ECF subfamily